jgi:hypothetical protein
MKGTHRSAANSSALKTMSAGSPYATRSMNMVGHFSASTEDQPSAKVASDSGTATVTVPSWHTNWRSAISTNISGGIGGSQAVRASEIPSASAPSLIDRITIASFFYFSNC